MSTSDLGLLGFAAFGVVLLVNLFGISGALAELFGPLKKDARWVMAGWPGTTWQWRMFGAAFLLFALAILAFDQGS